MKKIFTWGIIFSVLTLAVLTGCTGKQSSVSTNNVKNQNQQGQTEKEKEDITITMWFGRENFIPGDKFVAFQEKYPHITIKTDVIPLEQSVSEFLKASQAGNQPDIVQIPADSFGPLVKQGLLMDMSSYFETWKANNPQNYNNLVPLAWDMASWDNIPYGVTLHAGPFWYAYRQDLFEQAGIKYPPKTWDDVLDAGKKLKDNNTIGFSIIGSRAHDPVWFLSLFMSMGGDFKDGVPQLNSDAGIYLLEFYQKLMKEEIAHEETLAWDSGNMRAAFIGKAAAQALIGDNIFPQVQEAMVYGEQWNASPPPSRPGAEKSDYMALGWPYLVSAATEYPEEINELFQYMASTEIVKEVALRYQPTTNIAVLDDPEYVEAKPWAPSFTEAFKQLKPLPASPYQPQIYQVLLDAMQEALTDLTIEPALIAEKYQEEIERIVNE